MQLHTNKAAPQKRVRAGFILMRPGTRVLYTKGRSYVVASGGHSRPTVDNLTHFIMSYILVIYSHSINLYFVFETYF